MWNSGFSRKQSVIRDGPVKKIVENIHPSYER
jgi:hypothetical protein